MWFGIGKLIEEIGELGQIVGKLIPFPNGEHPDGKANLRERLVDEIADTRAALEYFAKANLSRDELVAIDSRAALKFAKFSEWGLTGIPATPTDRLPEKYDPSGRVF